MLLIFCYHFLRYLQRIGNATWQNYHARSMIRHGNLQYAESYVILHYQMMNVFITFLNVLKNFHVFNVLALFFSLHRLLHFWRVVHLCCLRTITAQQDVAR